MLLSAGRAQFKMPDCVLVMGLTGSAAVFLGLFAGGLICLIYDFGIFWAIRKGGRGGG
jgi:hypothetical protein